MWSDCKLDTATSNSVGQENLKGKLAATTFLFGGRWRRWTKACGPVHDLSDFCCICLTLLDFCGICLTFVVLDLLLCCYASILQTFPDFC